MNRTPAAGGRPEIQRTLVRIREETGLPLTFGGEVDAHQQVTLTQFAGATTGALRGVALECGRGLGGKVVALRRSIVVKDYVAASGISHQYDHIIVAERLRAMVAVPVVVGRVVRGVLYGALRTDEPIGDRVVRAVLESARDLEQNLAVRDEVTLRLTALQRYDEPEAARPEWELVRQAYAELRILANEVTDDGVRRRIRAACATLDAVGRRERQDVAGPELSVRELDVLVCVALGWTNARVANDLGIKVETVKSYLRSAARKLHAHSRMEAVVTARRLGLLP